jgi:ribosomal protein L11 methyltransferase
VCSGAYADAPRWATLHGRCVTPSVLVRRYAKRKNYDREAALIGTSACAIAPLMSRTWQEIRVEVCSEYADLVANFLHESGAPGTILEAHDDLVRITAHFAQPILLSSVAAYCDSLGSASELTEGTIAEEDWAENWKQHFPAIEIAERLVIAPPWDETTDSSTRVRIIIDPGMAFGTGHHATTSGCLLQIEKECLSRHVQRVLDYGCGSGILGIAALCLGAQSVLAVDIDPEACAAARSNAELNGIGDRMVISQDEAFPAGTFDLIAANLFADLLIDKIPLFRSLLHAGGLFISAGLLLGDEARVSAAAARSGFHLEGRTCVEGWVVQAWRQGAQVTA